jgi:hypothetical protein
LTRFRARVDLACFAVLLFSVVGCGRVAEDEAAKRVNALLPKYLGPARTYSTRVRGDSAGAILRGRLKRVQVTGADVQLDPDLVVDDLTLDFEEVDVDTKAQVLRSVGNAAFACRIGAANLDHYVRARRDDIPGLRVALKGSSIAVSMAADALGILSVPITVEGRLVPRGGGALDFEPDRARLSIVPIPRMVLDILAHRLNPVIELTDVAIPIQVTRAEVRDGALALTGFIKPDDVLRAASGTTPAAP